MADTVRSSGHRAVDTAADQGSRARDVAAGAAPRKPQLKRIGKAVGILAALAAIAATICTTVAGGGLALLLASPVLLALSPVLVPLAILLALGTGAFVATSAAVVVSLSVISWIYRYVKGRRPLGSGKVDDAKRRLADAAFQWTQEAQRKGADVTVNLQSKLHEVAVA